MSQAAADALVAEGQALFRAERYSEAALVFQRAITVFPRHAVAWRSLGQAQMCLGQPHEAARAFDQSIGLNGESATALWGGALAHADIGNKVVARDYLRRTLDLQPTWIAMAEGVPALAAFLQPSARAYELFQHVLGPFSKRAYRQAEANAQAIEIGRVTDLPEVGKFTFVTIGLADCDWNEPVRPRMELAMASTMDDEICAHVLANLAFHLMANQFYPSPGKVVRDVVGALHAGSLSQRLPHIYLQVPRVWGFPLPLDARTPVITCAQVCPISEGEYQMWRSLGDDRFERTLAARDVDLSDLRRRG